MFDWGQETGAMLKECVSSVAAIIFCSHSGGFTVLSFGAASDNTQSISLAYSESSYYWCRYCSVAAMRASMLMVALWLVL
jgi:hypothetical protein